MAKVSAKSKYAVVDLFAGAGGLSQGFREAGFAILAANDFDQDAANTFKLNHADTAFIDGPIQDITIERLFDTASIKKGELDVLVGGPPCQAFSVYNHQRGFHDERSGLFREYLRIVEGLMPHFVVMENVTGITSVGEGRAVDEIYKCLKGLGYHVDHRVLKAEEYGVPQERRRIFFVGTRDLNKVTWPTPTHLGADDLDLFAISAANNRLHYVTVADAISDLAPLGINQGAEEADYINPPKSSYQKLLRRNADKCFNHVAPYLAAINLERMKHIPQGGSWRDIPRHLLPAGMKKARRSDHTKRYGRLHPDGLCCTVLTKCDLHWGSYIHPSQERTLTVREAARIQSFPDHIRFTGSRIDQYRQVGNAVPPLLAKAVAQEVLAMLKQSGIAPRRRPLLAV